MKPLNCYICDNTSVFYCKNIYKLTSKHSETPICNFIVKFLGKELSRLTTNDEENIVCVDCLNKIDEYDQACMTVERVERELRAALVHTESLYSAEPVFVDILDGSFEDDTEGDKSRVKMERRGAVAKADDDDSTDLELNCSICDVSFNSLADFAKHKHTVSKPSVKEEASKLSDDSSQPPSNKTNRKAYKTKPKAPLKKEKQPKNFFPCSQCAAEFTTKSELKHHEKEHPPAESYTCEFCGVATKTAAGLSRHKLLHTSGEDFECAICQKAFKKKNSLARHMRIHTGEKFYQCDKCGVEFIHKSSFRMHIMAHDDIREKKCPHCTLSFRSTSHLNRHLRIHTGAKPYACPECGQKFAQRYNMMVHFRIHKGISRNVEKNHVCSICGIAFVRAQKLTEHYRKAHETIPHTVIGGTISSSNVNSPAQNIT